MCVKRMFITKRKFFSTHIQCWKHFLSNKKVIKILKGDTILININSKLHQNYSLIKINGIIVPKINSLKAEEIIASINTTEALSDLILNKYIELECIEITKYGNISANVYLDSGLCVNKWLIDNKYAVECKKQNIPSNWLDYLQTKNIEKNIVITDDIINNNRQL